MGFLSLNPYWLDLTKMEALNVILEKPGLNPYWLDLTLMKSPYTTEELAKSKSILVRFNFKTDFLFGLNGIV